MPTIKIKKEMNLPELIEWGFKNNIKNAVYNSKNGLSVNFSFDGKAVIGYAFSEEDTFTVEIEEEITEDTVLPRLVKYTYNSYYEHRDKSINMLDRAKEWSTFYYKDDNENMYLIWRDGKMVE